MDRLTEWNEDGYSYIKGLVPFCMPQREEKKIAACIDKLAAYEDAEERGLLVRLPCKVWDAIYVTKDQVKFPAVRTVKYISWSDGAGCDGKVKISALNNRTGIVTHYSAEDFGKTVFLTRAEAEAALKGEKNE